jgi:hypothetical protein
MALANYLYPHSATCVTEKSCVILVYPLGTASFVYVQHHYSVNHPRRPRQQKEKAHKRSSDIPAKTPQSSVI